MRCSLQHKRWLYHSKRMQQGTSAAGPIKVSQKGFTSVNSNSVRADKGLGGKESANIYTHTIFCGCFLWTASVGRLLTALGGMPSGLQYAPLSQAPLVNV